MDSISCRLLCRETISRSLRLLRRALPLALLLWNAAGAAADLPLALQQRVRTALQLNQGELQSLDVPVAAAGDLTFDVTLDGAVHSMVLWPHSVRSPQFTVFERGADGLRPIDAPPARTYRGRLQDAPDALVAATVRGGQLHACILRGDQSLWCIQPLRTVEPTAPLSAHIAYRAADVDPGDWTCGSEAIAPLQVGGPAGVIGGGCVAVAQLAFDSDYDFYELNGLSVSDTVLDIENVMNSVGMIYASQVGIAYELTAIFVQSDPQTDPYTTSNHGALLDQFRTYWNENNQLVERDVAHLMTGKDLAGNVIGVAALGVVCFTDYAYGLSQSRFSENFSARVNLTAHELGHNWNAPHCDADEDCGIMCSSVSGCGGVSTTFGSSSRTVIEAYRDTIDCLGQGGGAGGGPVAEAKLTALDAVDNAAFGRSVDLDGDVAVIGAYQDTEGGPNAGAAYVFRFNGVDWIQEAKLMGNDTAPGDRFGASVAIEGDAIVVGATFDDDGKLSAGSAYVFRYDGLNWNQETKLNASDPFNNDTFGASVDIAGNLIIVGAPMDDDQGINSGSAYIFQFNGITWVETDKLVADDFVPGAQFGTSVALTQSQVQPVAVVGAPLENSTFIAAGAAYVFRLLTGEWEQEQILSSDLVAASDEFGRSVDIDGALIAVGAWKTGLGKDIQVGAAYLYTYDSPSQSWIEREQLLAPDGQEADRFGVSVSLDGEALAVGAYLNDTVAFNAGAAYTFNVLEAETALLGKLTAPDGAESDQFGFSLATSGGAVLIGAWMDEDVLLDNGSAYVFSLEGETFDCNENGESDACDIALGTSGDCNGNGIPDECDIAAGRAPDLDQNGVPDDCDFDCNGNGTPDATDLALGISDDCNGNGVPDECDIATGGGSTDFDDDKVPDECQPDCNGNGLPDAFELAIGFVDDCNGNGVPDPCDLDSFSADSGVLFPIRAGFTRYFPVYEAPFAEGPVLLSFAANADLDFSTENIQVYLDGQFIGRVFGAASGVAPINCPLDVGLGLSRDEQVISAELWNRALEDGQALVELVPSAEVNEECSEASSFLIVEATYVGGDCNGNGVPDDCDVLNGTSLDCNENLVPDECEADCNGNGLPDFCDIAQGTAVDVDENGVPDDCQADCQGNGLPDDFEIATGISVDCNANTIPDECELADGSATDLDGNGFLDRV